MIVEYFKRALYTLVWSVGSIGIGLLVILVTFQEKLIYVPKLPNLPRDYGTDPEKWRMQYKDVWLTSADGVKLHAWLIFHSNPRDVPTMIFFQENAGNIGHRLGSIRVLMQNLSVNVFMLSYRGYGASEGTPSQHGIMMDAQAALDHVLTREDIDASRLVVFGRSLGGAVGAHLVKDNPGKVKALILENTFTSILDMAGRVLPWLKNGLSTKGFRPLNFLVRSQWRTVDVIHKIKEPILFISGLRDQLVPPSHMRELYAKAMINSNCRFVTFESGEHMDTWMKGGKDYWEGISSFLNDQSC